MNFTRAFTPSPLCSTARACLYSGQHAQTNGLWENIPLPYAPSMDRSVPTLGTLMRAAGYHSAYFGKWHLSRLTSQNDRPFLPEEVEAEIVSYGFDETGTAREHDGTLNGHLSDVATGDKAVAYIERRAEATGRPWFAAVNIVNPHDVMYYTAGPEMTASRKITYPDALARPPTTPLYAETLGYPVPEHFGAVPTGPMLSAANEYALCTDVALGRFPYEDAASGAEFVNYYYNCIRESDAQISRLLDALDDSGQAERTIVVFTADHGEMLGVHRLRGKGVLPYREAVQVPLLVRHPDQGGPRAVPALASHVDLAPTLLGLAGVSAETTARSAPGLAGHDLSSVILEPDAAGPRDDADGVLFHWTSLAYQDHVAALGFDEERKSGSASSPLSLLKPQYRGVTTKRGQMRGVFDGRYKFARFFAPDAHHTPKTWEELTARNDLELYDTETDPRERRNLAARPEQARALILAMNAKLNRLIAREVGADDGRHLPGPTFLWRA